MDRLVLFGAELAFAVSHLGPPCPSHCVLQIGYFKAKHAFFRFDWSEVEDECAFVLSRYFDGLLVAGFSCGGNLSEIVCWRLLQHPLLSILLWDNPQRGVNDISPFQSKIPK